MDSDIILKLRVKGGILSSHTIIVSCGRTRAVTVCGVFYFIVFLVQLQLQPAEAASWFVYNRQTSPAPEMWFH